MRGILLILSIRVKTGIFSFFFSFSESVLLRARLRYKGKGKGEDDRSKLFTLFYNQCNTVIRSIGTNQEFFIDSTVYNHS